MRKYAPGLGALFEGVQFPQPEGQTLAGFFRLAWFSGLNFS